MPLTQRIGSRFVAHRSGVSFSPKDIPGLQLWLKADAGLYTDAAMTTPAVNDADVVGGWADQSGQGNNATQATTANKPLLKLAIVNGKPVVRFASDDRLVTAAFASPLAQPFTIICVSRIASGYAYSGATPAAPGAGLFQSLITAGAALVYTQNTNTVIYTALFSGASSNLRINGTSVASGNAGASTMEDLGIGSKYDSTFHLAGDMAELLVYSALSTPNAASIEAYLNSRFALY